MSEEEAKAMLAKLVEHYQQPVMPLKAYCGAMEAWRRAVAEASLDDPDLKRLAQTLDSAFLAIRKSALLDRLIYGGEQVRTRKCPEHKGRWSGLEHPDRPCPHGCQLTGWIPNEARP